MGKERFSLCLWDLLPEAKFFPRPVETMLGILPVFDPTLKHLEKGFDGMALLVPDNVGSKERQTIAGIWETTIPPFSFLVKPTTESSGKKTYLNFAQFIQALNSLVDGHQCGINFSWLISINTIRGSTVPTAELDEFGRPILKYCQWQPGLTQNPSEINNFSVFDPRNPEQLLTRKSCPAYLLA